MSAWPSRHSVGPSRLAAQPRDEVRPLGLAPTSSHSKPASASSSREHLLGRALVARRVEVSIRISRWSSSTAAAPSCGRVATAASPIAARLPPAGGSAAILERCERLFDTGEDVPLAAPACRPTEAPLAARMRPRDLGELVGQEHLLGEGSTLRAAIESGEPHSAVFYGPPGSGKTTLARIVAANARAAPSRRRRRSTPAAPRCAP